MLPCRLCGSTEWKAPEPVMCSTPTDGAECDRCMEYRKLDREILEAKAKLENLLERQRVVKTEMNCRHDPLTSQLPIELTSTIFVLLGSDLHWLDETAFIYPRTRNEFDASSGSVPLTLGSVCQSWRRIVWSLPQLWSNLAFNLSTKTSPNIVDFASEWLERAGSLSLRIRALYALPRRELDLTAKNETLSKLLRVIATVVHRCEILFLRLPEGYLQHLQPPLLEGDSNHSPLRFLSLDIYSPHYHYKVGDTFLWNSHLRLRPTHARVAYLRFRTIQVSWECLTHFNGQSLEIRELMELIAQAPLLRECRILNLSNNWGHMVPEHRIHHEKLEVIDIEYGTANVWPHICCPALRYLRWDFEMTLGERTYAELKDFVKASSCKLKEIVISKPPPDLEQFLELTPTVESLHVLEAALRPSFFPIFGEVETILPVLHSFEYSCNSIEWPSILSMFPSPLLNPSSPPTRTTTRPLKRVLVILYAKWPGDPDPTYIDEDSLSDMLDLIFRGFDLRIIEKSASGEEDLIVKSTKHCGWNFLGPYSAEEKERRGESGGDDESSEGLG